MDTATTLADDGQLIRDWALSAQAAEVANGLSDMPESIRLAVWRVADAADDADDAERCRAGLRVLFADLVEWCNDRLDAVGRQAYAAFFPAVVWRVAQGSPALLQRFHHHRLFSQQDCYRSYAQRRARSQQSAPILPDIVDRVVILSRVTIGADVLLTSLLCQRVHQAFPAAEIIVVGDKKLGGLLSGLPQVRVEAIAYARRGPLGTRLASWLTLIDTLDALEPDLVLSPDSRLDQLAVLPLTDDPYAYLSWENIQNGDQPQSLAALLDAWAKRVLALNDEVRCQPRIAFDAEYDRQRARWQQCCGDAHHGSSVVAMKFDHGGNPAKSLPRACEVALLQAAHRAGWRVMLDAGFGDEETALSQSLLDEAGVQAIDCCEQDGDALFDKLPQDWQIIRFHGSIAGWASALSACQLAVSYDSVGHHLAAALGVPLLSLFTGHQHEAFPVAWAPQGGGHIEQVVIPTAERHLAHWQDHLVQRFRVMMTGCERKA